MGKPLRVLIVEDSQDDTDLLLRELQRGGFDPTSRRVDTAEAMSTALGTEAWDIVLADYAMPHFSGTVALDMLQDTGLDLPFIIVSGVIGEETAVMAMKLGAHDYILKSSLKRLVPAVQRELREAAGRLLRRQAEQALRNSEAYLRAVMDNVSDGIIIIDGRGIIQSINLAAQVLFGYLSAEAVGQRFKMLMVEPHASEYEAHLHSYLTTGEGRTIGFGPREVFGRHKDGVTFPTDIAISEMRLDNQRLFISSWRDASQRQLKSQKGPRQPQASTARGR